MRGVADFGAKFEVTLQWYEREKQIARIERFRI